MNDQEINQVANLLAKAQPGYLPPPIFHQITRLVATPIVEVVPLRTHEGNKVEVLLLERPSDDPVWPNMLHTPGTVIRATDSLESALRRILEDELGGIAISDPQFVDNIIHHSGRGLEVSQIYWVEVADSKSAEQFYDISELPNTLVESQRDFISQAVKNYKS